MNIEAIKSELLQLPSLERIKLIQFLVDDLWQEVKERQEILELTERLNMPPFDNSAKSSVRQPTQ